ncbi:hypothetical protein INT80_13240 [Gallibacterium anatis]|uniref:Uncharacterized protein n=1 Tax=Gallibacterium anatis TaxID=750 RepID=A0A930US94_9PAST|nr:hypothetical protein [Gallibacterium anatis]
MAQQVKSLDQSAILHKLTGDTWGYGWNVGAVYEFNETTVSVYLITLTSV